MSAKILDGRIAREALMPELIQKVKKLSATPTLAIIQVGDRPDSTAFIKAKKSFAEQIGVKERHIHLSESTNQEELIETIKKTNGDPNIQGIILQLPLPSQLDPDSAINSIDPTKDTDSITSANVEKWTANQKGSLLPATARGIRELLNYYKIPIKGKNVTVVGRSPLVGTPIAVMCKHEGANVTVAHRETEDLIGETKTADILIVAAGRPGLIKLEHIKEGAIVIDVGMTRTLEETLVGDVNFEEVKKIASAISPVPGGVGPMTVLGLFENLVDLAALKL
jgi:methylenetetrahydrofolate dehydrogenase (NADP+)/methenyltetrahydrofolate cyclohydrolase